MNPSLHGLYNMISVMFSVRFSLCPSLAAVVIVRPEPNAFAAFEHIVKIRARMEREGDDELPGDDAGWLKRNSRGGEGENSRAADARLDLHLLMLF